MAAAAAAWRARLSAHWPRPERRHKTRLRMELQEPQFRSVGDHLEEGTGQTRLHQTARCWTSPHG